MNILRVGGCEDWISNVSVGGRELDLYGRDFITLRTSVSATSVSLTLDNLTFSGRKIPPVYVNDINKDITIPKGLRISDVNSQLLFHLPNPTITNNISPSMITIPYSTEIPGTFNADWNTYLPVVPKILCTYTDTSTPSSKTSSLFNYYMNDTYPGVIAYKSGGTSSILKIDR
jgi:hypothetical protein